MKKVVYQKILLTHDGSRLASSAVPHAIAVAYVFKSEVFILQIVDSFAQVMSKFTPDSVDYTGEDSLEIAKQILSSEKEMATFNLNKLKDQLKSAGLTKIKIGIREGLAGDEIVEFAKKQRADLMIMSTHGRSGLGRVFLGSVADHVLRHAKCPVLLVHPDHQ